MASALLGSRAEPLWCCERKVYSRKNSNPNPNPISKSVSNSNPNPSPNSNPKLIPVKQSNHGRKMEQRESVTPDSNVRATFRGPTVTFHVASFTKRELKYLKRKLLGELDQVRKLRNRIENGCGYPPGSHQNGVPPIQIQEITGTGFQGNVVESQPKRMQQQGGKHHKKHSGNKRARPSMKDVDEAKMMGQCGQILKKLMGHKCGWVFNVPVDVVGMGLHDYPQVIKQPMDLGTVKSKLEQKMYSSPMDFASDVRLTFSNALKYNPEGHDVFNMASQLLATFEKMFGAACKKFQNQGNRIAANAIMSAQVVIERAQQQQQQRLLPLSFEEMRPVPSLTRAPEAVVRYGGGPSTPMQPLSKPLPPSVLTPPIPTSTPVPTPAQLPVPCDRHQPTQQLLLVRSYGKLPKPKARDTNKREMTFEEKQRLSKDLTNLPQDKINQAVAIMRRRNAALSQNDDVVEVDIEVLDNETAWELDRFIVNYKKMIWKIKKQEEHERNKYRPAYKSPVSEVPEVDPVCVEEDIDIGEEEIPTNDYPPIEIDKDASSSSDSSSSDASSSSDSDSGSSSYNDSDADNAQSPNTWLQSPPQMV